jgi:NAD(P)-dependent dehydrogenase (short-subunit alcohol dehydrogenase family)
MNIENCAALVTGANRGLGKFFCEALLAAGAKKVYAGARDPQSVRVTDDRIVPVKLDITQEGQVNAAAEACPDVSVVNNAGIMSSSAMLAEGSEASLRAELEVNVFGTLRMVRAFAPVLARNGGGAIANILSVASWIAFPHNATYGASKHAALALTDTVRFQLKAQGTQVVGVFSGYIDTDMAASVSLPKVSPLQVAERTLVGIREGQNSVYADEKTEDTWKALKADPEGFRARIQQMWDDGHLK